ncbi:MAG: DUF305 domain-containing protein [Actinomycetota bacterium]
MKRTTRTFVLTALALTGVLTLGACGASSTTAGSTSGSTSGSTMPGMGSSSSSSDAAPAPSGTPATGDHDTDDVTFATGMVPHHRQAVEMADLAATRASSPEVKDLAARIKAAQSPEIAQMTGWLAGWGAPAPSAMAGMGDMEGMGGDGMMSDDAMQSLEQATGTAFDVAFLTGMTAHHRGAVAQARTELSKGVNPEAKKLASAIIAGQTMEIAEMTTLLATARG